MFRRIAVGLLCLTLLAAVWLATVGIMYGIHYLLHQWGEL